MRALALAFVIVVSCADSTPTRTVLRFETASEFVAAEGTQLRLRGFRDGVRQHETAEDLGTYAFVPGIELPVEAEDDDASRRFTVFAELLGPDGERLSWARIRSGFVQDQRSEVLVEFAGGCPPPSDQLEQAPDYTSEGTCGSHDSCRGGACASACVEARAYGGTTPNDAVQCPAADDLAVDELEMGYWYTCARRDGEAFCWSQIGFRPEYRWERPSRIMTPNGRTTFDPEVDAVVDMGLTIRSACVAVVDGSVRCGGDNGADSLGTMVASGAAHCCISVPPASPAAAVDASNAFSCIIATDNRELHCTGSVPGGGLHTQFRPYRGDAVPSGLRDLFLGINLIAFYDDDGFVWQNASESINTTTEMPAEADVVDVSASVDGLCMVLTSGELLCWTREVPLEEQPGSFGMGWSRIALPEHDIQMDSFVAPHRCGVREDGTLWCWGDNSNFKLGVVGPASVTFEERVQVGEATDWVDVATANGHSCGIREGGHVYCWGTNSRGQLGAPGPTTHEPTRVAIPGW